MPAEVITMADCASNYGVFEIVGSKNNKYRVELHGSEGNAYCSCQYWKYRRDCKHITELWSGGACLYNPQWKQGYAVPRCQPISYTYGPHEGAGACPYCGGPMVWVRRAV